MIKLIVGTKGTGKTKAMIEAINAVTKTTTQLPKPLPATLLCWKSP